MDNVEAELEAVVMSLQVVTRRCANLPDDYSLHALRKFVPVTESSSRTVQSLRKAVHESGNRQQIAMSAQQLRGVSCTLRSLVHAGNRKEIAHIGRRLLILGGCLDAVPIGIGWATYPGSVVSTALLIIASGIGLITVIEGLTFLRASRTLTLITDAARRLDCLSQELRPL